eukprot:6213189-Pleurochrysis_carterae.AAC.2
MLCTSALMRPARTEGRLCMSRRGVHVGRLQPAPARGVRASCAGRAVTIYALCQLGAPGGIQHQRRGRHAGATRCDRRADWLARVRVGAEGEQPAHRERRAWRRGDDGSVVPGRASLQQSRVNGIEQEVMLLPPPVLWVIVDHLHFQA